MNANGDEILAQTTAVAPFPLPSQLPALSRQLLTLLAFVMGQNVASGWGGFAGCRSYQLINAAEYSAKFRSGGPICNP